MSDKIHKAGDVTIEDITIVTSMGFAQAVTPQVIGIEIYEDIFGAFITGKLTIRDSQELLNVFPLIGEEVVKIRVKTPTMDEEHMFDSEFYIYKMDDRIKSSEREMVYVLHFISKEAISDMNRTISRSYSGKISDIVKEIITKADGLDSKKKVNIEETENKIKYISNFWTPLKNLQYCADHAVNLSRSPTYVFYENKHGLNFLSLEAMYADLPVYQTFKWDNYTLDIQNTGGAKRDLNKDYQRILEINTPEMFDYMKRLKSGMYGSEIITYDILTRQYTHVSYKPKFEDNKHLNKFAPWTNNIVGQPNAVLLHKPKYYNNFDGYDDVTNAFLMQERRAMMSLAEASKITITVFGRTDYTVGQKIRLDVPLNTQITEKGDAKDMILSGDYIVAAMCHVITRKSHECVMELIKDSYMVDLNASR